MKKIVALAVISLGFSVPSWGDDFEIRADYVDSYALRAALGDLQEAHRYVSSYYLDYADSRLSNAESNLYRSSTSSFDVQRALSAIRMARDNIHRSRYDRLDRRVTIQRQIQEAIYNVQNALRYPNPGYERYSCGARSTRAPRGNEFVGDGVNVQQAQREALLRCERFYGARTCYITRCVVRR